MEYFRGLPYPLAVAALFVIVLIRGGATYALGRGAQAGARRTRLRRIVESDRFERASALVDRWGAPIVALSFLTVGFQTFANVAAGVVRMPLRRYLPALAVGGLAWAFLYATLGVLGFAGFSALFAMSPVAAILVIVGISCALIGFIVSRLRTRHDRAREEAIDDPTDETDRLAAHDRLA
jgi:membrane protein DedA with SNARE-associated domain